MLFPFYWDILVSGNRCVPKVHKNRKETSSCNQIVIAGFCMKMYTHTKFQGFLQSNSLNHTSFFLKNTLSTVHLKHSISSCLLHKHCWCSGKPVFAVWCKMHHYQSQHTDHSPYLNIQSSNHREIHLAATGLISIVWTRLARVWM